MKKVMDKKPPRSDQFYFKSNLEVSKQNVDKSDSGKVKK